MRFRGDAAAERDELRARLDAADGAMATAALQEFVCREREGTPPTQAWWLGKDPIRTKEIIEGQRTLP